MKKLLSIGAFLMLVLTVAMLPSCNKSNSSSSESADDSSSSISADDIVGKYQLDHSQTDNWELRSDGTFSRANDPTAPSMTEIGKWELDGETLTITIEEIAFSHEFYIEAGFSEEEYQLLVEENKRLVPKEETYKISDVNEEGLTLHRPIESLDMDMQFRFNRVN